MKIVEHMADKNRMKETKDTPMTLGERLKKARTKKDLTQAELATAVGIKQQAVQRIESGKVKSTGYIVQLARVLTITPEWLALGEEPQSLSIAEPSATYQASNKVTGVPVLQWDEVKLVEQLPLKITASKSLAVTGSAKCFALQIKDNSMTSNNVGELSFNKNDYIVIDAAKTPKANDFVVAKFPDSAQLAFRQFFKDDKGAALKALNTHYSSTHLTPAIKICGVVVSRYTDLA
jgi:SOS-response transcriptional repressor LexA